LRSKQDDVRPRRVGVVAALVEELQGLDAVRRDVEVVGDLPLLEGLPREANVAWVVLDEQDVRGVARAGRVTHSSSPPRAA